MDSLKFVQLRGVPDRTIYSILAMTSICETFGLVRPRMVEENVLIIQKGRHILYEMANEAYISNDTDMRHTTNVEDESEDATTASEEQSLVSEVLDGHRDHRDLVS